MKEKILCLTLCLIITPLIAKENESPKKMIEKVGSPNIVLPNGSVENKGYPLNPYSKPVSKKAVEMVKKEQQEAQKNLVSVIDNSIPGKWSVESVTIVNEINGKKMDSKVEKVFSEDYCISKVEINLSKKKSLVDKLALSNMMCQTKYENLSTTEAKFTLNCNKSVVSENFTSSIVVKGQITTLPKSNEMILDYDLKSTKNGLPSDSTKFIIKSKSKYLEKCTEKSTLK